MTAILSADGTIQIPEEYRQADHLVPGQPCEIERVGQGHYRVIAAPVPAKERLIDVLRSCPVRDWWVEPDGGERTTLESPRLFSE
jgi:bifunctional DNA-binding transcriptional regulator/antitoxin component of YhaV-PrlF toxin-antitoxin module